MRILLSLIVGIVLVGPTCAADAPTFETHVRPILKAYCFECHGEAEKPKGDLDVRLRRLLLEGGKSGPAIVPGKPDDSPLLVRVRSGEMPPGKKKLDAAAIDTLARWVAAGAKTERAEPESLALGMPITPEDRAWWAFQPVTKRSPPPAKPEERARNPVDAWLLAPLRAKGFGFNTDADKLTLIRRASFDLTGLPPTLDEIDTFQKDASPDAYEKLLDRLLASAAYGERWGRHWLDIAGYADSEGFDQADPIRTTAWRYRDYVIASHNADKPYDRFILEQIAGDELVKRPFANLSMEDREKLAATGFLRMAPDGSGNPGADPKVARNQVLADTIQIVSSSLLGMTVTCARCHNHRYDPIPQTDFYRLRAVLEPAFDPTAWKSPAARQVSLYTDADRTAAAACEERAKKLDAERLKKQDEFIAATLEKEFAKLPEADREKARAAKKLPTAKWSAEQKALMSKYPSLNVNSGSLYLYDNKAAEQLKSMAAAAAAERAKKPKEEFIRALTEEPGRAPPTRLHHRGDPDQPKQVVAPGALSILEETLPYIDRKTEGMATTGRRLAFARWLTDPKNPLVARVLVNRVWMHHFGRGLVGTPGDFGRLGERPTHPELLDWLAAEFVANGWSLKKFHKLLMTSTAYRQSSVRDAAKDAADPDNRLLGRFTLRRLDAESLRDAMLVVSGQLNVKAGGPPIPVMEDDVGQTVLGMANRDGAGYKLGDESLAPGEEFRRSVYVQVRRSRPLAVLDAFDWAVVEPNCETRNRSTVAPQSLFLMNNGFVLARSEAFARRVIADAGSDRKAQATRAWTLVYGAAPSGSEAERAVAFINEMSAELAKQPATKPAGGESKAPTKVKGKSAPVPAAQPVDAALAAYCQALLAGNRFLYID
ncbi:MAG: PSD1 domain-containing protein [Planctomycetia bacterium]|nr:PSD1 domain-containing protein [Planctomycetia bacterium]